MKCKRLPCPLTLPILLALSLGSCNNTEEKSFPSQSSRHAEDLPSWVAGSQQSLPSWPSNSAAAASSQPAGAKDGQTARVLVAYYSLSGNTEQMARAVAEGVKKTAGALAIVKKVEDVSKADLEAAHGIVLGSPAYYANIAGKMKAVIDDWSWKMKVDFTDKVGGAFATGGGQTGGKEHVVISLLLFMINNRMVVAGPLYQDAEGEDIWAELGAAAMTGPLDPGVDEKELDGARRLGERVAKLALKLRSN